MPLQNIGVAEGEFCRFETQIVPINDPYMKVEWFKDKKPVLIGKFSCMWAFFRSIEVIAVFRKPFASSFGLWICMP